MPLVGTGSIVDTAVRAGRGVGAFNVIGLEHADGLVAGAERAGLPVVLQISENCVRYHGALEPIARATLARARKSQVPVAVHLDHAESEELVDEAIELGFGSVMFDASKQAYEDNVVRTRAVAARCHDAGIWVEAELGEVGGKDGVHAPGARTDPREAAEYVAATGVDALAVAVGTSHTMLTRDAALDFGLIQRLREALAVPLVLHGSSGVSDEDLGTAIRSGMTKINISTHLNKTFTEAVREVLADNPKLVDPRKYLTAGKDALAAETARLLGVLAG
ncbi:fructose-bisphosphate aldolase, class II [Saccharopolyspora kobensis]|uniref:Fructose-bisphosphate aldolase, class II n=1 Tax=Saccharopolyspora kobensis TaxID=146035 RepID=A0A1H6A3S5_9PSEU|nr:class II fructose-bisphosphate aldolase [Saccharopolyspora kobensis]SEG42627.1 fructose-bisphosphate aldolase, class II [Saccharopolyspora kobensis]SFE18206.1 fructose-bisphosphate aldolase, class II [Saccharopolyspora kobensis]